MLKFVWSHLAALPRSSQWTLNPPLSTGVNAASQRHRSKYQLPSISAMYSVVQRSLLNEIVAPSGAG